LTWNGYGNAKDIAINMPSSAGGGAISRKRKLGEGEAKATKYYAVRTGKTPGVYTSWDDCKANTYGFKGAVCKFCALYPIWL